MIGSDKGKTVLIATHPLHAVLQYPKIWHFLGVDFLIEIKFETKIRAIQNCLDFITKDHPLTLNRKWR